MKKIVLFLLPLLLLSCNNTKENEPKEPEKEVQKYYAPLAERLLEL